MAGGNIKINPDLAAQLAATFGSQTDALRSLTSALSTAVDQNVGTGRPAWEGNSADQFVAQWVGEFKPALSRLEVALVEARELLNKTIAAFQNIDQ